MYNQCLFETSEISEVDFEMAGTVYSVVVCLIMIAGSFGNLLFIYVCYRTSELHTVYNIFLINLAVADTLYLTLQVPTELLAFALYQQGRLGETLFAVCLMKSFSFTPYFASMFCIAAVSVERYAAIRDPFARLARGSGRRAARICSTVWLLGLLVAFPYVSVCFACDEPVLYTAIFVLQVIPFPATTAVVVVCYGLSASVLLRASRSMAILPESAANLADNKQVIRVLAFNTVAYVALLLPEYIVQMVRGPSYVILPFLNYSSWTIFCKVGLCLNSAINCLIYTLSSRLFRTAARQILADCCFIRCFKWLVPAKKPIYQNKRSPSTRDIMIQVDIL